MNRPSSSSPNPGDRPPFEPGRKAKAKESQAPSNPTRLVKPVPPPKPRPAKTEASSPARRSYTREERAIPEVVSRRMVRRMAVLCGVPTALGFASFIGGYFINQSGWIELPNVVVLASSLGGLVVGIVGLSYGALSASWEEDEAGTWLGWSEFRLNLGRMIEANRANRPPERDRS